jgi:RHS repeat-associated protein
MPHLPLMDWNFKDQLSATSRQVMNAGTPETTYYVYGSGGQRARKITEGQNGSKLNERFYLGGLEIYREYASGSTVTLERETLRVLDDKRCIAVTETQTVNNSTAVQSPTSAQRYQLANHLGSETLELDATGALISYEEYSPYGISTYQAGRSAAEASLKRYRYSGKERDEENGFNYHGARYYVPWLGRWSSCDPGGIGDGLNVYGFCRDNPAVLIDANGRDSEPPPDVAGPGDEVTQDGDVYTHTDAKGDVWNHVVQYGDVQVQEWENEWKVYDTRFEPKTHTLVLMEHQVARLVTKTRREVAFQQWIGIQPEVITITGQAPK